MAAERTGRSPQDAAPFSEGVSSSQVVLNLQELMGGNFAFGALNHGTVADIDNFSQSLYDKAPVQVMRIGDPNDSRGFRYTPYDGHNRLGRLWRQQRREPGFVAMGEDVTVELKALGKYPDGEHFTIEQALELVKERTDEKIASQRFAGHLLTAWSHFVPEEISEKYPALAAVMLLGSDELRDKTEARTKSHLGIAGDGETRIFTDREGFHLLIGETDGEKRDLAFGLDALASMGRGTERSYDVLLLNSLRALHEFALFDEGEEQKRRQLAGILAVPAVHEKIIADQPGETVIGQRTGHVADLLNKVLPQATVNPVESRELRRALIDPHLSYDHLTYVLDPHAAEGKSSISERYATMKYRINVDNITSRLSDGREAALPKELGGVIRILSRGEILNEPSIFEIARAVTLTETPVNDAIAMRDRLAGRVDGLPANDPLRMRLAEIDAELAHVSNARTPEGLKKIGARLDGLVSRSEGLLLTVDTADSTSTVVYAAVAREARGVTASTERSPVTARASGPVLADNAEAEVAELLGQLGVVNASSDENTSVQAGATRAAPAPVDAIPVHIEVEAGPADVIGSFIAFLDGLGVGERTGEVDAALITARGKIDHILSRTNWKEINPDAGHVGNKDWFEGRHWPGEELRKNDVVRDLDRQQATLLFSRIARRELRLGEQEEVVMNYVRDGSGNTGLDALDNTLTNRLALMAKQLGWDSSTHELRYLVMSHYASSLRPCYEELATRSELSEIERAELSTLESLSSTIDQQLSNYTEKHLGSSTVRYLDILRYTLYTSPDLTAYGHGISLIGQDEKDSMIQKDIISRLQRASGITSVDDLFDKTVLAKAA